MPKKKSLTLQRVLVLLLAYIMLAVCGGVAASVLFVPGVIGANKAAKAVIPSLKVENVDFDVTSLPQKSTMYARDGSTVIATFYNQNRIVVPLKKISKTMQQAVVAREDRRFWTHAGVDVQGVMRAFVQTYLVKGSQQGGSSLTQQYVKNVLLMQAIEDDDSIAQYHATEDTIARKIREMLISVQMEKKYSKAEILQGYLNIAQFGNNLYGVETAAQRYFSVSAADLNVVQSATIAAITKNPSLYDPLVEENQKESENQRNIVLKLMLQEGYITQDQYTEAVNTPLKDTLKVQDVNVGCQDTGDYAYFCDFVVHRIQNSEEFGKTRAERNKLLQEGGLKIVTTLDVEANSTMMETARNTIPPDDPSGMEIAMAAVKPGTGEVLSFGLNRYYDATPAAANDPTRTSQNYAVDLTLFDDLDLTFDYFIEDRSDILIERNTVPAISGLTSSQLPRVNMGEIKNKGYEITLDYNTDITRDLNINFGGNFSYARNKVISADEAVLSSDYAYRYRETGFSLGQNWGYIIDHTVDPEHGKDGSGFFNSKEDVINSGLTYETGGGIPQPGDFIYKDLNGDHIINEKDMAPIKYSSLVPRISYGFHIGASYKGFDFSVMFQGVGQYSKYYSGRGIFEEEGSKYYLDICDNRWNEERYANGEKITHPRLANSGSVSHIQNSYYIMDAAYMRLKNAEIGYTFPARLTRKAKMNHVRIYISGDNLCTWTALPTKAFDPEQASVVDYPLMRTFNCGINIQF